MSNLTYLNDASVLHNLKQRYYAKLIYVRLFHPGKKKKENVSPFLFCFFFRVFVSSPSTVNRDESVDRLCTNENVGQRHRIDVSPRFFSYSSSSSSSNKIHPRLFENCMFFREISILTRHAAFMQFFLQNASFYKTRTRVTTYLSLSLSFSFLFLKKIGNNRLRPIILFTIVFASFRFSSKTRRNEFDRVLKFSYQDTRYFFFFPLPSPRICLALMPSIIEKSMTMMMKNRGISCDFSKRRFPFVSRVLLYPFPGKENDALRIKKPKKKKKEEMEKISNIDRRTEIVYILINELINVLFSFFPFPQNFPFSQRSIS